MKKLSFILLFLPIIFFGQCDDNCKKEEKIFPNATYFGCLNDSDEPNGHGVIKFDNGEMRDGCWENGKMNGSGEYISADKKQIYDGNFKNGNFYGIGKFTINSENQITIQEGFFKSDNLFNGTETVIFSEGLMLFRFYKDAEMINEKRNTENIYNLEDIIGDEKSTVVILERRDNHFWIKMEINDMEGEWVFDTGGEGLSIGKKLWNRLLNAGVNYKDILLDVESSGVSGGIINNKYVLIDEISIGDYKVKNVVALIRYEINFSLMGADFYDKFSNIKWNMNESTLEFYK